MPPDCFRLFTVSLCQRACSRSAAAYQQCAIPQEGRWWRSRRVVERWGIGNLCLRCEGAGSLPGALPPRGKERLHGERHMRHGLGQSFANSHVAAGRREQILGQLLQ